ncbi:MAG: hypothetical protein JW951_00260 [Lentisphaerae bacterium]|nr:hypothetical protein [Lentisphaerota bacterium]
MAEGEVKRRAVRRRRKSSKRRRLMIIALGWCMVVIGVGLVVGFGVGGNRRIQLLGLFYIMAGFGILAVRELRARLRGTRKRV